MHLTGLIRQSEREVIGFAHIIRQIIQLQRSILEVFDELPVSGTDGGRGPGPKDGIPVM